MSEYLKENVRNEYINKIRVKIMVEKRNYINKLKQLSGMNQIVGIMDLEKEDKMLKKLEDAKDMLEKTS